MKTRGSISLLFILIVFTGSAQNFINLKTYNVDSLLFILPDQQAEERVNTLNNLAISLFFIDSELARQYADEAMKLSEELSYEEGKAAAYYCFANFCYYQGKYPETIKIGFQALDIYEKLEKRYRIAKLYLNIAGVHLMAGNYQEAIACCDISLDKFREQLKDGGTVGSPRDTLSACQTKYLAYQYGGMFEEAKDLAIRILDAGSKNVFGESEMTLMTFKVGQLYFMAGEIDSAKVYFEKALEFPDVNPDVTALKYRPVVWLGFLNAQTGEIDTALSYLKRAYTWYNKNGFLYWSIKVSNDIGSLYYRINEMNRAENYYRQSERIFREIMNKNSIYRNDSLKYVSSMGQRLYYPVPYRYWSEMLWIQVKSMFDKLHQISKGKENTLETLKYQVAYLKAADTLNRLQRNRELIELRTRYESERKDQEIDVLSLENSLNQQTIRTQYYAGAAIGIGLLSVILFSIVLYRGRQRQKKINIWLEEKVQERTLQLEEAKTNLESAYTELQSLDVAKNDFLEMISHEIRTPLNGIVGAAHVLKDTLEEDTEMGEFVDMLKQSADRLESFSTTALIITQLQTNYQVNKERCKVADLIDESIAGNKDLAVQKGVTVYKEAAVNELSFNVDIKITRRVIGSIINNAVRYSPKHEFVRIKITKEGQKTIIAIIDKGRGFTEQAMNNLFQPFGLGEKHYDKNVGLSLKAAKMVMELQGGEIAIENLKDGGACVRLIFLD